MSETPVSKQARPSRRRGEPSSRLKRTGPKGPPGGKGGGDKTGKGGKGTGGDGGGGGIAAASSPPTSLTDCKSVRVYTNTGDNNMDRTVSVHQVAGSGWPPGSKITIWTGDQNQEGNPPPATGGNPFVISKQGEDVTRTVKPKESVYVHYGKPDKSNITDVNAIITTS